jgi:Ca-activated chloride channel family protein
MSHEGQNHEGHEGHEEYSPNKIFVLFVCFVVFTLGAAAGPQTFRARIETVLVTVTVHDADNRIITGLSKDDFEIFEDGTPQVVTQFSNERVPISLGILLDASDSMRGRPIVDARAALDRFVADLLHAGDEAFVASFNHVPTLVEAWTRPASTLKGRLDALQPWGSTAIYDALVASAFLFNSRQHARAALIVISDGSDTASDLTLLQTRDILRRADPFVYAVAIDSPKALASARVNPEALREITAPSGGYTEVVTGAEELVAATERIANELNHQYLLGYVSARPADGQWRTIRVRMKNDAHFTRARRGYFAVR